MQVHRSIDSLPHFSNSVLTIGSFDGLHKGHRKIVQRVIHESKKRNGESILISFHPHPKAVIYPKANDLVLLHTVEEKINTLETLGLDHLVLVPFTIEFSQQHPLEYIETFLVEKFQPSCIIIGYDHRFGLNREGNIDLLKEYAAHYKYEILEIEKQELTESAISSTRIRKAIAEGQVNEANNLLGQPYQFTGKIVHGEKIGGMLGYPTANLSVMDPYKLIPCQGIYAVRTKVEDQWYNGMMYIGNKPTLDGEREDSIEVNIFDFSADVYGKDMEVHVVGFVREDKKFKSLKKLKAAIGRDKVRVEEILEIVENEVSNKEVAIALLNYNGREILEKYLPSLIQYTSLDHDIYVIDNASNDASIQYIQAYYPEIKIVELDKNYGFAEGYNQGLKQINNPYTILLNTDVRVTPNWVDPLIAKLKENKQNACVQPKILSDENVAQFEYAGAGGGKIDILNYPYCDGRILEKIESDQGQYDAPKEIFWASGAAMAIRTNLFHSMTGFDATYFAHQEEIDLCWRLKKAGYKICYEPKSVIYHLGGGTLDYNNPKKIFLNFRNNHLTIFKNESVFHLLWKTPLRILLDGVACAKFLLQGEISKSLSILKAWGYILTHILTIIKKRRTTNKLILANKIGESNSTGKTNGLLLWKYFRA